MQHLEQLQSSYQSQIYKIIENNTSTIELLLNKWNNNPPLNQQDMEQILTKIISEKIMPDYGAYVMTMFIK